MKYNSIIELIGNTPLVKLNKIEKYFEELTAQALLQKPESCEYTRLELILGQFRHQMWHVGLSSAITFEGKKIWNEFTGLNGLRKFIS